MPSVGLRAREQISRRGAPHLGFEGEIGEVEGWDVSWDEVTS
jgi:hypothetical protein